MKKILPILFLIGGVFWLLRRRANEQATDTASAAQNNLNYFYGNSYAPGSLNDPTRTHAHPATGMWMLPSSGGWVPWIPGPQIPSSGGWTDPPRPAEARWR